MNRPALCVLALCCALAAAETDVILCACTTDSVPACPPPPNQCPCFLPADPYRMLTHQPQVSTVTDSVGCPCTPASCQTAPCPCPCQAIPQWVTPGERVPQRTSTKLSASHQRRTLLQRSKKPNATTAKSTRLPKRRHHRHPSQRRAAWRTTASAEVVARHRLHCL